MKKLTDIFTEASEERSRIIAGLKSEVDSALRAHDRSLAEIEARKRSALDWIDRHREEIILDYGHLLLNISDRDESEAQKVLDRLEGTVAGIILNIPVDTDADKTASFESVSRRALGPENAVTARIRTTERKLPEEAYTGIDPATLTGRSPEIDATVNEPSLWDRVSGTHKELQQEKIGQLRNLLAAKSEQHATEAEEARIVAEQAIEDSLKSLGNMARCHFRLFDTLTTNREGRREEVRDILSDMRSLKNTDAVLSVDPLLKDGESRSFAKIALTDPERDEDKAGIYADLVRAGAAICPDNVLSMTFERSPPLPAEALLATLESLREKLGRQALENFLLRPYKDGPSLLERAAAEHRVDAPLMRSVLEPLGHDIARAALLLRGAKTAQDDMKETLTAMADRLCGTHLRLSESELVRTSALRFVHADPDKDELLMTTRGVSMTPQKTAPDLPADIVRYLGQKAGFIRAGSDTVLNAPELSDIRFEESGYGKIKIVFSPSDDIDPVEVDTQEAEEIAAAIKAMPDWVECGGVLLNVARLDNIWIEEGKGKRATLKALAFGKTIKAVADQADVQALFGRLANDRRFYKIKDELINTNTMADVWYELEKDSLEQGKIRFSSGISRGCVTQTVTPEEATSIVADLVNDRGFFRTHDLAAANPCHLQAVWAKAAGGKLDYIVAGKNFSAEMPDSLASAAVYRFETVRPDMVRENVRGLIDTASIDCMSHDAEKKTLHYRMSGEEWVQKDIDPEKADELISAFDRNPGVVTMSGGHHLRTGAVDALWGDKGLKILFDGKEWDPKQGSEEAARLTGVIAETGRRKEPVFS